MLWLSLIPLLLEAACVRAADSSVVTLKAGKVRGASCQGSKATNFLGIPFAQPPTGSLRFAAPESYNSTYTGGTLNATAFKPICPQFGSPKGLGTLTSPSSEDCLYLNVFTPDSASADSNLPVKIFIYGGSFVSGGTSDPLYNGCNLASDAIVVTVAYRLGPFGFLALEGTNIAGNQGLRDVMMGAQWVQDNIAAFGGNPKNVLLFGESAGAGLTWITSTMPNAPSLMKAAVAESGSGNMIAYGTSFQEYGAQFAQALGCAVTDTSCLQSKSTQDLIDANPVSSGLALLSTSQQSWKPWVDGKFIPFQPATLPAKVPFLTGTNADEGTLFILAGFNTPTNVTSTTYTSILSTLAGSHASTVASAYPLTSYNTSSISSPDPGLAPFYALAQIFTDFAFKCPARRTLNLTAAAKVPTYTYRNNHTPQCAWEASFPEQIVAPLGATHSSELQFVFAQTTNLAPPNGSCSQSSQEREITRVLTGAWTSMAANGEPGKVGGEAWPVFDLEGTKGLVIANDTTIDVIDYSNCDAIWDKLAAEQLANATANGTATGSGASPTGGAPVSSSSAAAVSSGGRSVGPSAVGIFVLVAALSGAALTL